MEFKQRGLIKRSATMTNIPTIQEMDSLKNSIKQDFATNMIDSNKQAAKLISNNIVTDAATITSIHSLARESIEANSQFKSLMAKNAGQLKSLTGAHTRNLQNDIYRKYAGQPIPAYDGQGNIKFINEIKGSGYDVDHTITVASILPNGEHHDLFIDIVRHCDGKPLEAIKLICRGEFNLNLLKSHDNQVLKNSRTGSKVQEFSEAGRAKQKELEDIAKSEYTKDKNKNMAESIVENAAITFAYVLAQRALTMVLQEVADSIMDYTGVLMYEHHYDYSVALSEATTSNKIKNVFIKKWNQIKHLISFEGIKEAFTWENVKALFKTILVQGVTILISSISSTAKALMASVDIVKNLFQAAKSTYDFYTVETYEEKHEAYKDMKSYVVSALSAGLKALIYVIDKVALFITLILNPLITMIAAILIFVTRMYIDVEDKLNVKRDQFNTYMDRNF